MSSTRLLPLALIGLALLWLAMLLLGAGDVDRTILLALYARDEPWLALAAKGVSYSAPGRRWSGDRPGGGLLLYLGKRRALCCCWRASQGAWW